MRAKYLFVIVVMFISSLYANELTKVGIVDTNKVYQRYIKESSKARKFNDYKEQLEKEISKRKIEIDQIEQELIKARDDDNEALTFELDSKLKVKKINLQEYVKHKNRELNAMISTDASKSEFSGKLYDAIRQIGLQNGYSVILKKSDPAIIWMHNEVDITELVIQELMK